MTKLLTPLVTGTVIAVILLGIVRLLLVPKAWLSSLVALAFLPLAIAAMLTWSRSRFDRHSAGKIPGKIRASLVGAGVLLASSLLLSITDELGYTGLGDSGDERSFLVVFLAIVAVAVDLFSARLEKKAEKTSD